MYQPKTDLGVGMETRCTKNSRPVRESNAGARLMSAQWLGLMATLFAALCLLANTANGQVIANNTPRFVSTAQNLGPENPSEVIDVSIWLNLRNPEGFDSAVKDLYDRSSPQYHHWLEPEEISAKYGPVSQDVQTVVQFAASHNLKEVTVGPNGYFVRAHGSVADMQRAFHVQINQFEVNGKTYRANLNDPTVEGPAAAIVRYVSGLDNQEYEHPLAMRGI